MMILEGYNCKTGGIIYKYNLYSVWFMYVYNDIIYSTALFTFYIHITNKHAIIEYNNQDLPIS